MSLQGQWALLQQQSLPEQALMLAPKLSHLTLKLLGTLRVLTRVLLDLILVLILFLAFWLQLLLQKVVHASQVQTHYHFLLL